MKSNFCSASICLLLFTVVYQHQVWSTRVYICFLILFLVFVLTHLFLCVLIRAYDVGDPVYFVDDTGNEDWYIVTRINMLTTVSCLRTSTAVCLPENVMRRAFS